AAAVPAVTPARAGGGRPTLIPSARVRPLRRPGQATGAGPPGVSRIPVPLAPPRGGADDPTTAWRKNRPRTGRCQGRSWQPRRTASTPCFGKGLDDPRVVL